MVWELLYIGAGDSGTEPRRQRRQLLVRGRENVLLVRRRGLTIFMAK